MNERVGITVYVDREILEQLREVARNDERSLSKYLERLILGSEQFESDLAELARR